MPNLSEITVNGFSIHQFKWRPVRYVGDVVLEKQLEFRFFQDNHTPNGEDIGNMRNESIQIGEKLIRSEAQSVP